MLRRQQAEAVIAARQKIVQGAVSMVEMALEKLADKDVVQLNEDREPRWWAMWWCSAANVRCTQSLTPGRSIARGDKNEGAQSLF